MFAGSSAVAPCLTRQGLFWLSTHQMLASGRTPHCPGQKKHDAPGYACHETVAPIVGEKQVEQEERDDDRGSDIIEVR